MRKFIILLLCFSLPCFAAKRVVNIYIWSADISNHLIKQFEKETGIKVNLSTYDSNEEMYAKIRATGNPGYDILLPSSYYIHRMRKQNLLLKIDKTRLSNYHYQDPLFTHGEFDPKGDYSIPFEWGVTGIFVNKYFFPYAHVTSWKALWQPQFHNQLLILNDPREAFAMAFMKLGYPANDQNPQHIYQAYLQLKKLLPNIRVFNNEAVSSLAIDGDASIGMIWNGDFFNAQKENKNLSFVFPSDGVSIWLDCFAIPKGALHIDEAYQFLNFMMRPEVEKYISLTKGYATANLKARELLPKNLRHNPIMFPSSEILQQRGQLQTDISDEALALYEKYWEQLKISA